MKSLEDRRAERLSDEKERLKLDQAQVLGGNLPGDDGSEEGADKTAAKGEKAPIGKANAEAAKTEAGKAASGNGGGSGFTGKA